MFTKKTIDFRKKLIDLHCHILPKVDDGPKTLQETKKMLSIAAEEGIATIAATHHFLIDEVSVDSYLMLWNERKKKLQSQLDKFNVDIKIVRGAEVLISPFLPQLQGIEKLCINGSRYLLIELPMLDIPQYTEDVIYNLRLRDIIPIIAHPERNRRIVEDPNSLYPLVELGTLCQINTGSITGLYGKRVKRCARILFDNNMAHLLGTDSHSSRGRSPRVKGAVNKIIKWKGNTIADKIIYKTPKAILNNVFLEISRPVLYRKCIFF